MSPAESGLLVLSVQFPVDVQPFRGKRFQCSLAFNDASSESMWRKGVSLTKVQKANFPTVAGTRPHTRTRRKTDPVLSFQRVCVCVR